MHRRGSDAPEPPLRQIQRLLFIDEADDTQRLACILSERGHDVTVSSSALEALSSVEWFLPDAVVMELKLPDTSGMDCFRQIRDRWPHLRVIILTGYPSIATAIYAVRLGAWDYLTKPADASQIQAALHRDPLQKEADLPIKPPSLFRLEWEHIQRVLADHGGNVSQAAAALGLHRRSLQRKLMKLPPVE